MVTPSIIRAIRGKAQRYDLLMRCAENDVDLRVLGDLVRLMHDDPEFQRRFESEQRMTTAQHYAPLQAEINRLIKTGGKS